MSIKVAIGSENPRKVAAVKKAFEARLQGPFEFVEKKVDSGVPDQPFDDETLRGAINRAKNVRELFDADFGVGLEGGIAHHLDKIIEFAWCAIVDRQGEEYCAHSFGIPLPKLFYSKIKNEGKELGDVLDEVLGTSNIKQKEGFFGFATNNHVTRESGYHDMVHAALAPLVLKELYERE